MSRVVLKRVGATMERMWMLPASILTLFLISCDSQSSNAQPLHSSTIHKHPHAMTLCFARIWRWKTVNFSSYFSFSNLGYQFIFRFMHEKNVEALVKSLVTQLNTCSCPFDVLSSFEKVFDVLGLVMPPFQIFPKYRQFDFLFEWIFSLVLGHF